VVAGLLVIGGLPLILLALACGASGAKPLTASQKSSCTVRIYFSGTATHTQEQFVAAKLRDDARVARVRFTSKARALALMKKEMPSIFKAPGGPKKNPLPDRYTAVPGQLADLTPLGKVVTAAHWPGVGKVNWGSSLDRSLCGGASDQRSFLP